MDLGLNAPRENHLPADLQEFGQFLALGGVSPDSDQRAVQEARHQDAAGDRHLQAGLRNSAQDDLDAARPVLKGFPGAGTRFRVGLDLDMRIKEQGPPACEMGDRSPQGLHAPGRVPRSVEVILAGGREGPGEADVRNHHLEVFSGDRGHDGQRIIRAGVVRNDEQGAVRGDMFRAPNGWPEGKIGEDAAGAAAQSRRPDLVVRAGDDTGEAAGGISE